MAYQRTVTDCSWVSAPKHCTSHVHVLECGHLVTSKRSTPCANNCTPNALPSDLSRASTLYPTSDLSPSLSGGPHEYVCRICRSLSDAAFLAAADTLGLLLSLHEPELIGTAAWRSDPEMISLHDPALPSRVAERLDDKLAGRKLWFSVYTHGAIRGAYAFVLDSSLRRYIADANTRSPTRSDHATRRAARRVLRRAVSGVRSAQRRARRDAQKNVYGDDPMSAATSACAAQDARSDSLGMSLHRTRENLSKPNAYENLESPVEDSRRRPDSGISCDGKWGREQRETVWDDVCRMAQVSSAR